MSYKTPEEFPYPCPLCGASHQVSEKDSNSFDICEVCGWEDDGFQLRYPDETGANLKWTFNAAKKAWENGETLYEQFPNPKGKS